MTNPLHTDFLAFLPAVIERLNTVNEIKKVFTANDLSDLNEAKTNTNRIDGCVYVVLDSFAPASEASKGKNQAMDITFSVILAKQYYNKTGVGDVGATLTAIAKALIGYEPTDGQGQYLTLNPIYLDKGAGVLYQQGFALYPLRFKTQSVKDKTMFNFFKKSKTTEVQKESKLDKKSLMTPLDTAIHAFDNETYDDNLNRLIAETGKSRTEILNIILNDDEVEGCRDDIESAIKAMPFIVWGDELDENTQNELIKIITPHIKTFAELAVLAKFNGHAIAEYVYKQDDKGRLVIDKVLNRVDDLDNYRFLRDGRIIFNHLGIETAINTEVKNLVLTHRATPARPMGQMTVIKAYPSVLLRNKSWAYLGQFIVRYAQPYIVGKQSEFDFNNKFVSALYRFVSGGATTIDKDSEIQIHQLQNNGQAFEMAEQMSNRRIQKLLLGRVKTSDQTHGSRSANETDDKARIDRIGSYLELAKEAIQHAINAMLAVNAHFGTPLVSGGQVWFEWKNEKAVDKTRAERDKLYLDTGRFALTKDYYKDILGYEEHHFTIIEPAPHTPKQGQELPLSLLLSDSGKAGHRPKDDHNHSHDDEPLTEKQRKIANAKGDIIQSLLDDSTDFADFEKKLAVLSFDNDEFVAELTKQGMSEFLKGLSGVENDG
ncbi:Mu-like prophage protein gp29 [Moraxella equi]|nr:Mu-like prophage protein gp29 [Moraxella equi]